MKNTYETGRITIIRKTSKRKNARYKVEFFVSDLKRSEVIRLAKRLYRYANSKGYERSQAAKKRYGNDYLLL